MGDGMSYGYLRAEVIGAFVSVITIYVLNIVLIIVAIEQIVVCCIKGMDEWNKASDLEPRTMLYVSGAGVAINFVMGWFLHQPGHSHGAKAKNFLILRQLKLENQPKRKE